MAKQAGEVNRKTPAESAPFDFNFTDDLITGETISSATFHNTSDLTVGAPSFSSGVVQFNISGGTLSADNAPKNYDVEARIVTSLSNTYAGCGLLVLETCGG